MLSYFLGGDTQSSSLPDFPNTEPTNEKVSTSANAALVMPQLPGNPIDKKGSSIGLSLINSDDEDDEPMAPPTPRAPQFISRHPADRTKYGSESKQTVSGQHSMTTLMLSQPSPQPSPHPAVPSSASSSSSSLSTMAKTLVSGGPMVLQQMRQQQPQQEKPPQMYASMVAAAAAQQHQSQLQRQGVSPVSPAAMIGTPENLMLPPPPSHGGLTPVAGQAYQGTTVDTSTSTNQLDVQLLHPTSCPSSQHQHMAWLNRVNAMAKAGRPFDTTQPPNQQQHNVPQQPQGPSNHQPQSQQFTASSKAEGVPVHVAPVGLPFTAFPHMFYGHAAAAAAAALQQGTSASPEESEEKRAKRLERNRESARISRRRKKERLTAAEARVWRTHQKIARERQRQIEKLVPGLRKLRSKCISKFLDEENANPASIMTAVRETSPNSPIFQAVIDFQFNSLQAALFPRYQKLWLWMAMNEESYYATGKEEFTKRDPDKLVVRTSSGKISSKQVGEDLINSPAPPDNTLIDATDGRPDDNSLARTCHANDAARLWPLFCYEHKFSVDQEDKFLTLHKNIRQSVDTTASWNKSQAAIEAALSLRDAIDFVCRVASNREEQTLVGVLRADQISKYRQWIVMNHDRYRRSLQNRHKLGYGSASAKTTTPPVSLTSHQESLRDICLRLERLRIPKSDK